MLIMMIITSVAVHSSICSTRVSLLVPMEANTAALVREMFALGTQVTAQVALGLDREEVLQAMHTSYCQRIPCMIMTQSERTALCTAVAATMFGADQKKELGRVILSGHKHGAGGTSARRPMQSCRIFEIS